MESKDFITLQAVVEHHNSGGDNPWIPGDKFHIRLDTINEIGPLENRAVFDTWEKFQKLTFRKPNYQYAWDEDKTLPHRKIAKICKATPIGLGINGTRHYVWITEESYRSLCEALGLEVLE